MKSGNIYIKHLFNENRRLKTLNEFSTIIQNKSNWLCEYKIIQDVFKKYEHKFNYSIIPFTKDDPNPAQYNQSTKYFYSKIKKLKLQTPCSQNKLSTEFKITNKADWEYIYLCKIKLMEDTKLAEFNYKLLNNILCNNYYLSKWNSPISKNCYICQNQIENIRHLIFDCVNVLKIWKTLSEYLGFNVQWKHIIIGFYHVRNNTTKLYNLLFSCIAYRIYKHKMFCRIDKIDENENSLVHAIRDSVGSYANVMKHLKKNTDASFFQNFFSKL